jgi:iron complex transport system ATP-binding protein
MIEVKNLGFAYNSRTVLRDISININDGEVVGIIGPNGAGKTTLIRLITGLLRPGSGRIIIKSDSSTFDPKDVSRRFLARYISVLPQNPSVLEDYTVEDIVVMGRYARSGGISYTRDDYEIAEMALKEIDILPIKDRFISQLSGGEIKMTLIARTIAQNTPILIFDEPTADLDLAHRERIMEFITEKCRKENRSLLIVMHDITLSARYLNRLILIAEEKIISDGLPRDVITEANILKAYHIDTEITWYKGAPFINPLITKEVM